MISHYHIIYIIDILSCFMLNMIFYIYFQTFFLMPYFLNEHKNKIYIDFVQDNIYIYIYLIIYYT